MPAMSTMVTGASFDGLTLTPDGAESTFTSTTSPLPEPSPTEGSQGLIAADNLTFDGLQLSSSTEQHKDEGEKKYGGSSGGDASLNFEGLDLGTNDSTHPGDHGVAMTGDSSPPPPPLDNGNGNEDEVEAKVEVEVRRGDWPRPMVLCHPFPTFFLPYLFSF